MKNIIPVLITATTLLLAGCSATHTIQNDNALSKTNQLENKIVKQEFIYNLLMLAKCNPQILDDYTYMYDDSNDISRSAFYALYFTPFPYYFTPRKPCNLFNSSPNGCCCLIDDRTQTGYIPPFNQQPKILIENKFPQPVKVTRERNYIAGGYVDYAITNKQFDKTPRDYTNQKILTIQNINSSMLIQTIMRLIIQISL